MNDPIRPILEVEKLAKYFSVPGAGGGFFSKTDGNGRHLYAVDGISFTVLPGETMGLAGESGCGKSTAARTILRLLDPTGGKISIDGKDITALSARELRPLRRNFQMIFQDPYASLNPRMTVSNIVGEPLEVHGLASGSELRDRVEKLLFLVGLKPEHMDRYPHEFSGGQRQRIGIARAIATNPRLVIGDEPVSALDVSIRAQVINLLEDLQSEFGLTYLVISHDLSVLRHMCDKIAVMYLGRIVESADTESLFEDPKHPYTLSLLSAIPVPDPESGRERIILQGDMPSPINRPTGCHFHPRCPRKIPICETEYPPLVNLSGTGEHLAACHLNRQ